METFLHLLLISAGLLNTFVGAEPIEFFDGDKHRGPSVTANTNGCTCVNLPDAFIAKTSSYHTQRAYCFTAFAGKDCTGRQLDVRAPGSGHHSLSQFNNILSAVRDCGCVTTTTTARPSTTTTRASSTTSTTQSTTSAGTTTTTSTTTATQAPSNAPACAPAPAPAPDTGAARALARDRNHTGHNHGIRERHNSTRHNGHTDLYIHLTID